MSGSHGHKYEGGSLLGFYAMLPGGLVVSILALQLIGSKFIQTVASNNQIVSVE
jgi:hypothetical protein